LLADQYNEKWRNYLGHQEQVLAPFEQRLRNGASLLDVGCGVGLDSYILSEHGFSITGIDVAEKMIFYAKQNAPKASFQNISFFSYKDKFVEGIVMDAFLHLFPKKEVPSILSHVRSLLLPGGYGFISTTQSKESYEGYYEKEDYKSKYIRFRAHWMEDELKETLEENHLKIVDSYTDTFQHKEWMNIVFQVS